MLVLLLSGRMMLFLKLRLLWEALAEKLFYSYSVGIVGVFRIVHAEKYGIVFRQLFVMLRVLYVESEGSLLGDKLRMASLLGQSYEEVETTVYVVGFTQVIAMRPFYFLVEFLCRFDTVTF